MSEMTIERFYENLLEEISMASEAETYGWEAQDFFTAVVLEYLEESGEVDSPVICPFRGYGLQLNAYAFSEDYENVDIFVSVFNGSESLQSVSRNDIDAAIKRGIQLYRKATNDLYTSFEKDNDVYEFAITIHDKKSLIKNVRIIALTNGNTKPITLNPITIEGVEISFSVWDIDRLYRFTTSGKMRETIEIDLVNRLD